MTVAVVLPDGVGIRNFVLGRFMNLLGEETRVLALYPGAQGSSRQYTQDSSYKSVDWVPLLEYRERASAFMLRYISGEAHMYKCNTQAMRHTLRMPIKGSWKNRMARHAARRVAKMCANYSVTESLTALHGKVAAKADEVTYYRQLLTDHDVKILFCSHQRPPEILPVVLAAKQIGARTGTFIFSWDNLSTKARIAAPFDDYYVWSDLMRRELLTYYPEVAESRVHVIGTPQFDPYADPELLWSRSEFCRRIGADPTRPLLCYSGGDSRTCPEDELHVRVVLEQIRRKEIKHRPQVILRPMPVDNGERYQSLRDEFPELIYAAPEWVHSANGNWAHVLPLPADVQFLANLTTHADVNVNVASTMTLDFAIHDKPVVNIAFDISDPPILGVPLAQLYYQFEHYLPVVQLGATRIAFSREELASHINAYLDNPLLDKEARAALVRLELGTEVGKSAESLVAELTSSLRPG
jgi:hypothetical protein